MPEIWLKNRLHLHTSLSLITSLHNNFLISILPIFKCKTNPPCSYRTIFSAPAWNFGSFVWKNYFMDFFSIFRWRNITRTIFRQQARFSALYPKIKVRTVLHHSCSHTILFFSFERKPNVITNVRAHLKDLGLILIGFNDWKSMIICASTSFRQRGQSNPIQHSWVRVRE